MQKSFSIFQALVFSFFSKDLYRDVARQWRGLGLSYVFMILVLCLSAVSIYVMSTVNKITSPEFKAVMIDEMISDSQDGMFQAINTLLLIINQLPELKIDKGLIKPKHKHEDIIQTVYTPQTKEPLIQINTSGEETTLVGKDIPILIASDRIVIKEAGHDIERVIWIKDIITKQGRFEEDWNIILDVLDQIPAMQFENYTLKTETKLPRVISIPQYDHTIAIIDDGTTFPAIEKTDASLLLLPKAVEIKSLKKDEEPINIAYKDLTPEIMQKGLDTLFDKMSKWINSVIFTTTILSSLILFIFIIPVLLLLGGFANILCLFYKANSLDYDDCIRIVAIAFTPTAFIGTLMGIYLVTSFMMVFCIWLVFIQFGIYSNREVEFKQKK